MEMALLPPPEANAESFVLVLFTLRLAWPLAPFVAALLASSPFATA
jgi:hypothetical protein